MSLTVSTELHGEVAVIAVAGELDMATAPTLLNEVGRLVDAGRNCLVLDLTDVSFCDSTGLSIFVRARNRFAATGGEVRLAAPRRAVRRLLEVSGLIGVLPTYPTVVDALGSAPAAR